MFITVFRTFILYFFIIFAFRFMGKRQIGELQPYELVVTIMMSEIAVNSVQNPEIPLISGLIPVLVIVCLEIILSGFSLLNRKIRSIVSGNVIPVIIHGKIDQKALWDLRFSVDDIMEELRKQNVFDVREVEYACVETTGTLSVYLKTDKQNLTPKDMNLEVECVSPPLVIVSNGIIIKENLLITGLDENWIEKTIKDEHYLIEQIYIMTSNNIGDYHIIPKEKYAS